MVQTLFLAHRFPSGRFPGGACSHLIRQVASAATCFQPSEHQGGRDIHQRRHGFAVHEYGPVLIVSEQHADPTHWRMRDAIRQMRRATGRPLGLPADGLHDGLLVR